MSATDCCIECWEEFRYDDCGGYNPPCACGFHCRRCHDLVEEREREYAEGGEWDDEIPDPDASPRQRADLNSSTDLPHPQ